MAKTQLFHQITNLIISTKNICWCIFIKIIPETT